MSTDLAAPSPAVLPPAPKQAQSLLPRPTLFSILLLCLLLLQFSLLRLGLLFTNHTSAAAATHSQLAGAFLRGLRFDLATACYLLLPFIILAHLPRIGPTAGPRARRCFFFLLSCLIVATTFILLAEYEFFREFQTRYNQLAFQYLDQPRIVLGMIWYNYPIFRYILICFSISLIVLLPAYLLSRRLFRNATPDKPLRLLISLGLLLPCLIIAMRGGFQTEPLRWGDAYRSTNDFSNQLGLNGIFCLVHSFVDRFQRRDSDLWLKSKIPLPEARSVARRLVVSPGESLLDPDHRTVFRRSNPAIPVSTRLKSTPRPPNVVLVIMESFSARFCGAAGSPEDLTPNFSRIAADGILFDHAFSGGIHTHQGIFCTMLGFPNLPGHEYLLEQELGKQLFSSLPAVFHSQGYRTLFLYNGNFAWDNMRGFFQKQGVDTFIGTSDFINPSRRDKVWGVADQDVFDRANQEFDRADQTGKPFFSVILTLSNHIPFDLPDPLPFPRTTDHGDLNRRLDALRYADWSIGRFIDQAKKLPYFNNTLFVFVGDHGFHVDPVLTETHLLFHHVPLLFYSPNLLPSPSVNHTPSGQTNIAPTIIGLLGLAVPHSYWARNLFDTSFPDPNFVYFKGSGNTGANRALAFLRGDTLLQISSTGSPSLYHYTLWPPTITPRTNP
ncbi:MAG TPA: LTA synthase family protein, partial [Tepidisphaeraceae bacterium]|nr:LTA synthase family protein [Tepidisphaeraceae bacterium]